MSGAIRDATRRRAHMNRLLLMTRGFLAWNSTPPPSSKEGLRYGMGELEGVRQQQKGDLFFSHSFGVSLTPSNQSAVVGGDDDDAYSNRGGSQDRADCIHFTF